MEAGGFVPAVSSRGTALASRREDPLSLSELFSSTFVTEVETKAGSRSISTNSQSSRVSELRGGFGARAGVVGPDEPRGFSPDGRATRTKSLFPNSPPELCLYQLYIAGRMVFFFFLDMADRCYSAVPRIKKADLDLLAAGGLTPPTHAFALGSEKRFSLRLIIPGVFPRPRRKLAR